MAGPGPNQCPRPRPEGAPVVKQLGVPVRAEKDPWNLIRLNTGGGKLTFPIRAESSSFLPQEDQGMSAIPEEFIKQTDRLSQQVTRPFSGSRKIYIQGSQPDIRVPIRESLS